MAAVAAAHRPEANTVLAVVRKVVAHKVVAHTAAARKVVVHKVVVVADLGRCSYYKNSLKNQKTRLP